MISFKYNNCLFKINQAIKNNSSLSKEKREELKKYLKDCKKALDLIKDIGTNIINKTELK